MNKESLPNFTEKCISLRVRGSKYSHDLLNPYFEYQGGKLFIIGTVPEGASESGWDNNQISALDWEYVIKYTLFENYEEYKKAAKIADNYQPLEE